MDFYMIIISTIATIFLLNGYVIGQISEPQQYAATAVPKNPSSIRQALGYNKYDANDVKSSDKRILYGNNWELFDNNGNQPQNDNSYQPNQYYGNQQPYNNYYR